MSNRSRSVLTVERTISPEPGLDVPAPLRGWLRDASVNAEEKAPPRFKNLQVLKDVPPDQLIPDMRSFMSASLGVEGEFGHVRDAFEEDDKQSKQTARRMIRMMLALERDQFHGERAVTCYTCRRGSVKPVSTPIVDSTAAYVSEARSAADPAGGGRTNLPSAGEVIDKYLEAVGGAAPSQNVSSRVESGTVTFDDGPQFPIEILSKSLSRQAMIHLPAGDWIPGIRQSQSGHRKPHGGILTWATSEKGWLWPALF